MTQREAILAAREENYHRLLEFYERTQATVLFAKVNMPGDLKNIPEAEAVFRQMMALVEDRFQEWILENVCVSSADGTFGLVALALPPLAAKVRMAAVEEETPLGRLMDLDIFDGSAFVSRIVLGLPERRCFVCGENARGCIRLGRHSVGELLEYVKKTLETYIPLTLNSKSVSIGSPAIPTR